MKYDINTALKNLLDLSEDVPNKPPLPTEDLLEQRENELEFTFSNEYKDFLLKASNVFVGYLSPFQVLDVEGSYDELTQGVMDARKYGVPANLLPICEDNGDYYCLDSLGRIQFWSHDGISDEKWESLAQWITEVWLEEANS